MDHGNPSIAGATVWFCSDEHVTFAAATSAPGRRRPGPGRPGPRRPDDGDARGRLARRRRRGARPLGRRPARLGMSRRREQLAWLAAGAGMRSPLRQPVGRALRWRRVHAPALADAVGRRCRPSRWPCGPRSTGHRRLAVAVGRASAPPAWRWPRRSSCRRRQPPLDPTRPAADASSTPTCCTSTGASPTCPSVARRARPRRRHVQRADARPRRRAAGVGAGRRATRTASSCRPAPAAAPGCGAATRVTEQPIDDRRSTTPSSPTSTGPAARPGDRRAHPEPDRAPRRSGSPTSTSSAAGRRRRRP